MPMFSSRLLTLMAGAVMLLGAASAASAEPRDSIRLGMSIEPAGLDPTVAAPVAIGQVVWQNVFEGLTASTRTERSCRSSRPAGRCPTTAGRSRSASART